jgi:hypothetical protein
MTCSILEKAYRMQREMFRRARELYLEQCDEIEKLKIPPKFNNHNIKQCPFCAGLDCFVQMNSMDNKSYVSCPKCKAIGPREVGDLEAKLAWNNRA